MAKYISIDEAAQKLGKSVEDLRAMMNAGELRGFQSEGTFKFKEEDVNALAGGGADSADSKEDTLMSLDADVLFAENEGDQPADAAAETWIAADLENVFESDDFGKPGDEKLGQADAADALGGQGLEPAPLPLSPEKDDTALGTVLMDDGPAVDMGGPGEESVIAIDPESGIATITSPTPGISRTHMIVVNEPEPRHMAFTPLLVVGVIATVFALLTILAATMGVSPLPGYVETVHENLMAFAGGALGVALIAALVGFVLDRQKAQAEAAAARMGRR